MFVFYKKIDFCFMDVGTGEIVIFLLIGKRGVVVERNYYRCNEG